MELRDAGIDITVAADLETAAGNADIISCATTSTHPILRAALTQTQLSIPLLDGRLALGTWQGIWLFEHRARPHRREIALHLMGA